MIDLNNLIEHIYSWRDEHITYNGELSSSLYYEMESYYE